MTAKSVRTIAPSRRPNRTARPNVVKLIPGQTPLPIGPRSEGG